MNSRRLASICGWGHPLRSTHRSRARNRHNRSGKIRKRTGLFKKPPRRRFNRSKRADFDPNRGALPSRHPGVDFRRSRVGRTWICTQNRSRGGRGRKGSRVALAPLVPLYRRAAFDTRCRSPWWYLKVGHPSCLRETHRVYWPHPPLLGGTSLVLS